MMTHAHAHSSETFAREFRESIRVGFNWDRFLAERWPVEVVVLTSPAELGRIFMPWYIGTNGEEVAYDHPGAVPMKLTDLPKAMHILNSERQADILKFVDEFRDQVGLNRVTAPAYGLPNDQFFVLDGNHRLSALAIHSVPFDVTLWNVNGPIDWDCLLDLVHWLPESNRAIAQSP